MVNVNTQVGSSVEFPFGEFSLFVVVVMSAGYWPFPASAGSDSGWKRHPRLPFSHDLNPGGVSEAARLVKRLLEPWASWRRGGFLAASVLALTSESLGSASSFLLKRWKQFF